MGREKWNIELGLIGSEQWNICTASETTDHSLVKDQRATGKEHIDCTIKNSITSAKPETKRVNPVSIPTFMPH